MSVWLPRQSSSLVARRVLANSRHGSNSLIHPRVITVYHLPLSSRYTTQLPALRLYSTQPPSSSNNSRDASTSTSTSARPHLPDVPTAEPKNPPAPQSPSSKEVSTAQAPLATRAWKKVKHEAQHYWHGSKLLVSEVRISARLQWKLLHGDSLTRRERRQVCNLRNETMTASRQNSSICS